MDRIDAMRAFATSVDRGSLAAAARGLGHSSATVTRAITLLEKRLGMKLLHRSTRALRLTEFGKNYLTTCREVLRTLDAAERGAAVEQEEPSGLLTITAPLMFGQLHLRPVLDAFLDANPSVQARFLLLDRVVNLVDEGIDIAVRLAHLPDSTLVATRLGDVRRVLCASPAYLAQHGVPETASSLREHQCIMERDGAETEIWRFAAGPGRRLLPITIRPRLVVNSAAAAVASAIEGHGITRVMSYQAAEAVAVGKLIVLLAQNEPPPVPVSLILPPGGARTANQRSFVDFAIVPLRKALGEAALQLKIDAASLTPRRKLKQA
jgi:DNA-binding transcriptional LysR family regulator